VVPILVPLTSYQNQVVDGIAAPPSFLSNTERGDGVSQIGFQDGSDGISLSQSVSTRLLNLVIQAFVPGSVFSKSERE
jgi:hypothetical protein